MNRKELILSFVFILGAVFTGHALYQNEILRSHVKEKEEEARQEWFLKQNEAFSVWLPSSLRFMGVKKSVHSLPEFVGSTSRLGLYMNKEQFCLSDAKERQNMEELLNGRKEILNPFVLIGDCHPRDLRLLQKQDPRFPLYCISLDSCEIFHHLSQQATPFFFVLHPNGRMSDVVLLSDPIRPYLNTYVDKLIDAYEGGKKVFEEKLVLFNPSVNVGEIPLQERFHVMFYVKNQSNQTYEIQDIGLSCDCLTLVDAPKHFVKGSITKIGVTFTPDLSGDFIREVTFQVKGCKETFVLTLYGTVL